MTAFRQRTQRRWEEPKGALHHQPMQGKGEDARAACPYRRAPHTDGGIDALASFGRKAREEQKNEAMGRIKLTGLQLARMIGNGDPEIRRHGVQMLAGSYGPLEYVARNSPYRGVRERAIDLIGSVVTELSCDEEITRAPEWYANHDFTELQKETKDGGQDSKFVKGLAGILCPDSKLYGIQLRQAENR